MDETRDTLIAATPLPARHCPICGQPNGCVAAATGSFAGSCWCQGVPFSAQALAQVPEAERGRACICRVCASMGGTSPASDPAPG